MPVPCEDSAPVREGARRRLEDSAEVVVEAAVASAPDLLEAGARLRPAGVLTAWVEVRVPPAGGTGGTRNLAARPPDGKGDRQGDALLSA